jgi:hypothetical protein
MNVDDMTTEGEMASLLRFLKLFPKTRELEITILKGHLLIEENLRELIDMKLPSPQALEDARLTTHQVICLAEAFFGPQADRWFWDILHRLNKLRNDIAHKVQPRDIAERMREISEGVKAQVYPKTGFASIIHSSNSVFHFGSSSLFCPCFQRYLPDRVFVIDCPKPYLWQKNFKLLFPA